VKIKHLSLVTSAPSVTMGSRESVPSPYGPVRAGLTTSQITQDQRLSELLSSLESVVENLNYKSFTLYDMLNTAIEEISAVLSATVIEEGGTDADWS
jgi:hypothetical protein